MSETERSPAQLLASFFGAVASGAFELDPPTVPSRTTRLCWQWVLRELDRGPTDPKLIAAVTGLVEVDPHFPHGQFLLGMALRKVGRNQEALAAFRAHAELRPLTLPTETRGMIEILAGLE